MIREIYYDYFIKYTNKLLTKKELDFLSQILFFLRYVIKKCD